MFQFKKKKKINVNVSQLAWKHPGWIRMTRENIYLTCCKSLSAICQDFHLTPMAVYCVQMCTSLLMKTWKSMSWNCTGNQYLWGIMQISLMTISHCALILLLSVSLVQSFSKLKDKYSDYYCTCWCT